ncbi:hypothetical protein PV328_011904, partial [Microctonus aethiopoides]
MQQFGISKAHYDHAWVKLIGKYENSETYIEHHTQSLCELAPMSKNTYVEFRRMINDAKNYLVASERKINANIKPDDVHVVNTSREMPAALILQLSERKLERRPNLQVEYAKFMREYEAMEHIPRSSPQEFYINKNLELYLMSQSNGHVDVIEMIKQMKHNKHNNTRDLKNNHACNKTIYDICYEIGVDGEQGDNISIQSIDKFKFIGCVTVLTNRIATTDGSLDATLIPDTINCIMTKDFRCSCPLRFYGGIRTNNESF